MNPVNALVTILVVIGTIITIRKDLKLQKIANRCDKDLDKRGFPK